MLSFGRKPTTEMPAHMASASQSEAGSTAWVEPLTQAIGDIRAGREPDLSALPAATASALTDLHKELKQRNAAELERTVGASVQNSNAMAAVSRATLTQPRRITGPSFTRAAARSRRSPVSGSW